MQSRSLFRVAAICLFCGCSQQPTNPAVEVMQNPPEEVDSSVHSEVLISLNGSPALGQPLSLRTGEPVHIQLKLIRRNKHTVPMASLLLIRVLPEGSSAREWGSYEYIDEFVCIPDSMNGSTTTLDSIVKAPPGTYEYRCYSLYHAMHEEKPELTLISKGRLTVSEAAAPR